jgi:WD40 repeat protein
MAVAVGLTVAPVAQAQYFGRNKVQYEEFEFNVLETEHFDIHYYPEVPVEYAALMAERWYERLSRLLDHELEGRQKLILYAAHPHFQQTNALGGQMDEGTQGVTELLKRRIVLPYLGPLKETDHVIGHELVHAFQFDITGEGTGTLIEGVPGAARMPLWFVEGMAEYLSVGHYDSETAMWMRALVSQDVPTEKLISTNFHPYQHGQALWAYIAGRYGDDVVGRLLKAARTTPNAGGAFQRVLRIRPEVLLTEWLDDTRDLYEPLVAQTENPPPSDDMLETGPVATFGRGWPYGSAILSPTSGSGRYNISPSISPDGSEVVFLSEKDMFAIEMYLADARDGRVTKKIVKTAVDPHFEGLQFIQSAGAWDRTGQLFAFAAVRKGQPALSILDVKSGKKVREEVFKELGEIFNPTWSPDGRYVVFTAIAGGVSDLFSYDLNESELHRLTNDPYGDLHPAWSPDGSTVAFITERFTSNVTSMMHGEYTLALMDPSTGAIRELEAFNKGKHINPQWSPDGKSLYFISDQNGISNVYRMDLESRQIFQVTNVFTGVSGIAPLSPALSVAAETGEMTVSLYRGNGIEIFRIDDPEVLAGRPVIDSYEGVDPAVLPPVNRTTNEVLALIDNPFFGLPADTSYASAPYRPGLGLDYISQPSLVVGADRFGTYIGGGASLFWSDILGGHNLATALQVNGGVKDINAAVAYSNMSRRLNWGVTVQQYTYTYGGYFTSISRDPNTGQIFYVDQILRQRQISREVGSVVSYPFSRVSRLEMTAGYRNITYDWELQTDYVSQFGELFDREKTQLESPSALNLGQASTALVYDNSYFGIASPILGQRYRIEAAPTIGSLDFWTALVDVRKYVMPVRPFTLAGRILHYGRYGQGGGDQHLQFLHLGYPGMVRGYDYSSFSASECSTDGTCPVYDQLLGSRLLVGNLELRFPPFGVLGLGSGMFGFLPIEMGIFADAGIAWGSDDFFGTPTPDFDERAFFLGGDRKPVYSAGVSFRFNMFNYLILGLDWVKPFQRPDKGMYLQFTMVPGF